jgi:hypothetical protein
MHGVIQNKKEWYLFFPSEACTFVEQVPVGNEIMVGPIWIPSKAGGTVLYVS